MGLQRCQNLQIGSFILQNLTKLSFTFHLKWGYHHFMNVNLSWRLHAIFYVLTTENVVMETCGEILRALVSFATKYRMNLRFWTNFNGKCY